MFSITSTTRLLSFCCLRLFKNDWSRASCRVVESDDHKRITLTVHGEPCIEIGIIMSAAIESSSSSDVSMLLGVDFNTKYPRNERLSKPAGGDQEIAIETDDGGWRISHESCLY